MHNFLRSSGKFSLLCGFLTIALLILPFIQGSMIAEEVFYAFFCIIILTALYAMKEEKWHLRILLVLGWLAIICNVIAYVSTYAFLDNLSLIFNSLFLTYIMALIFKSVFYSKIVTLDVILGSLCIYLLMGFVGGLLYALCDAFQPHSFAIPHDGNQSYSQINGLMRNFIYYSFSTLTGLGCDINPLSMVTRYLSVVNVMIGQFYLGILVARLVGMYGRNG